MKKFLSKFNDIELTLILEVIVGAIAIGLSFIGFAFKQYGWTIGIAAGTAVSLLSTVLVFKGSDGAIKESKTGLYLLSYFVRMILFVGVMILFAVLQYKLKVTAFNYSIWGALIGYTPMFIILIVGQLKSTQNTDKKMKEKDKEQ